MQMQLSRGVSWGGRSGHRRSVIASAVASLVAVLLVAPSAAVAAYAAEAPETVSVIVRRASGSGAAAEEAVRAAGGEVQADLGIIDGFAAEVPKDAVAALDARRGVESVTQDAALTLHAYDGFDPQPAGGSMMKVTGPLTNAEELWQVGNTGKGVDVALIDSGVAAMNGLNTPGKVLHGPDLSFESQDPAKRHVDTFGHGTHLAGIIAGRDDSSPGGVVQNDPNRFWGMAPDARIVSLKVADAYGNTDVSQVIAAIDWVVQNRRANGLNIRVLNLSFGTDGVQDYRLDPLTFATEVAWRHGIVVVVAAGNGGFGSVKLNNPAYNPFVIAVGGADGKGTATSADDVVGDYSSRGDSTRSVDLVAPGTSIVSLRAPGSTIESLNPAGHVGTRLIRGTGTSQAAAVVSGAAAVLLSQRPELTPDEVKAVLKRDAQAIPGVDIRSQGAGMLRLSKSSQGRVHNAAQPYSPGTGTGSLDLARGTERVADDLGELAGEIDIFGAPFDSSVWARLAASGGAWVDGTWNGNRWSGSSWSGNRWSSAEWTGNRWSGNRWSADLWTGNRWSGNRWFGNRWSSVVWH